MNTSFHLSEQFGARRGFACPYPSADQGQSSCPFLDPFTVKICENIEQSRTVKFYCFHSIFTIVI